MRNYLVMLVLAIFPAIGFSKTIHVPGDYPTIQAAIDAAAGGDTVLVDPDTYVENIDFGGRAITVKSKQGADFTVIDGGKPSNPDFGSVVTFQYSEGPNSVLEGFTITNGTGSIDGYWGKLGGGIYCTGSSPTIIKNVIEKNTAATGGGIAAIYNASPTITHNLICNNKTYDYCWGGGGAGIMAFYDSSPLITNNLIIENQSDSNVAGIGARFGGSPEIFNNIISGNTAKLWAGGLGFADDVKPVISNNFIMGNSCGETGGGILITRCSVQILNNTVFGNSASITGGGLSCYENSSADVFNTIFWNNRAPFGTEIHVGTTASAGPSTLSISYSDVEDGLESVQVDPGSILNWGSGMIDSDPLFLNPANGDFHLTHPSPCRDTGNNNVSMLPAEDFEGDPRIAWNGTVDMGADEFYTHLYWTGNATPGGNVEVKFVGWPGTTPVGLCIGTDVLDTPFPSMWGNWYLQFPILGPFDMGKITSPEGVLIVPATIPGSPPAPYSIPMQALIGAELTNHCVLEVK